MAEVKRLNYFNSNSSSRRIFRMSRNTRWTCAVVSTQAYTPGG